MALLRVKRRADEDPIDVLLLACKKQKTEDSAVSTVFKFAATVNEEDKDRDIYTHVNNFKETYNSDNNGSSTYKKRQVADITDKLRTENKLFSQSNRLKVINCFRHVEGEDAEQELTVIDIENHPTQGIRNEVPKDSHSSEKHEPSTAEQYVYDLYYSNEADFDEIQIENMLSAHAVNELMFDMTSEEEKEEETFVDDDDDSNDENNWRNDYPDEKSDNSSIEENDILLAMRMRNVDLDGEYVSDLSSDKEDEALLFHDEDRGEYRCFYSSENSDSDDE